MLKLKTKGIYVFIAVIGLLIFLHFIKVLTPIEKAITSMINPLTTGFYSISSELQTTYNEQTSKQDFLTVINNLEQDVNRLTVENFELKLLADENKKLRQALKFFTQEQHNYVLANIISQSLGINPTSQEKNLIINKGRADGLVNNLAVVNNQGVIIGKIIEIKEKISKICLVTDNDCKLAAFVQGQTEIVGETSGVVEGELGLTIKMNFIPQTEKIAIGDVVATSGLEKNIPRGLVIGKIIQVDDSSNEVWQSAVIEPLVNLDSLAIVSILIS